MKAKRPFSDADWQQTPEPVKQYIISLEQTIALLIKKRWKKELRSSKVPLIRILRIPVNRHHPTAHLKSQRINAKRVSARKEPKKDIKAINKNSWNQPNNK
jgi:hypothetical protein